MSQKKFKKIRKLAKELGGFLTNNLITKFSDEKERNNGNAREVLTSKLWQDYRVTLYREAKEKFEKDFMNLSQGTVGDSASAIINIINAGFWKQLESSEQSPNEEKPKKRGRRKSTPDNVGEEHTKS